MSGFELQEQWQAELEAHMDEDGLDDEQKALLAEIRSRRGEIVAEHRRNKALHGGNAVMPRSRKHSKSIKDMEEGLGRLGMSTEKVVSRMRSASAARQGRKRERSLARQVDRDGKNRDVDMEAVDEQQAKKRVHSSRSRSMSRGVFYIHAVVFGQLRGSFALPAQNKCCGSCKCWLERLF